MIDIHEYFHYICCAYINTVTTYNLKYVFLNLFVFLKYFTPHPIIRILIDVGMQNNIITNVFM